jgi:hypothetical protein
VALKEVKLFCPIMELTSFAKQEILERNLETKYKELTISLQHVQYVE